jgi:hypothetical protein
MPAPRAVPWIIGQDLRELLISADNLFLTLPAGNIGKWNVATCDFLVNIAGKVNFLIVIPWIGIINFLFVLRLPI